MIDFRYHLVSLIAVFLAVALGIVIGTTQLNQPILEDIRNQVSALEQDKRELENTTQQLQAELDDAGSFAEAVAPALVEGTLAGQGVVLLTTGDDVPTETVDEVTALLEEAGAEVTGQVTLQPEYSDPATASQLQSYVTGPGLPTGVTLPETDDTGQLVAALLAQTLMVPASGGAAAPDDAAPGSTPAGPAAPDTAALSSVLAGLSALDVLTQESASVTPADHAVLLTAGAPEGDDAADRSDALVDLVSALDAAGSGAVVAGDGATAGETGVIGVIRADPSLSAAVSTVDNVGSATGRVSTVLALGQESEGTSGKYGTGEDTQPVPPVPAAAP
ncbi:copper transporter [Geodermatophilus marinus]|uniref:copper transporter n=1 Tax=Geodermatophilus sp. LHW52908 TaxID=2303986 RepID=UPI000E3BBBB6|nr:copper transporter [Geodermatophilus sp. LHW52908]RFU19255.1 copper transporter [Geodermatophilus sp. LHW52908]